MMRVTSIHPPRDGGSLWHGTGTLEGVTFDWSAETGCRFLRVRQEYSPGCFCNVEPPAGAVPAIAAAIGEASK